MNKSIMRDEKALVVLKNIVDSLEEIDMMIESQSNELSKIDSELSDWLHLIENNELKGDACVKVVEKIHNLRLRRRALQNEFEIENVYKEHKNKLVGNNTRQFFTTQISQKVKTLNCEYKNRVITDDDIADVLSVTKRRRGRPRKNPIVEIEKEPTLE